MTKSVGVHEAKTHLSRLIEELAGEGQEIVITNRGHEVARLVPPRTAGGRRFGLDEGVFDLPEDFDATDPEIVDLFEL